MSKEKEMKHPSLYLDWYVHVPKLRHDFRSSGIVNFKHPVNLGEIDFSINYERGNPEALKQTANWYDTTPENVFISSEGATGQNARLVRYLAERNPKKKEAIVEFPTYEPLLRTTQEHFPIVKRLDRREKDSYRLDSDRLGKLITKRTGLLVLTNPHAPSGAISNRSELKEIMNLASNHGFFVLCDEIYAEFDRKTVPTLFSVDPEMGIVTTSFTKAYGLGGLKLGIALASQDLVGELYTDVLNTVGNSPNIVQIIAEQMLGKAKMALEEHKRRWTRLKRMTEKWLTETRLNYYPNNVSVTYWVKLPITDTCKWTNERTIPKKSLAAVPGTFFLFGSDYKLTKSNMIRLGIGAINPKGQMLNESLCALGAALKEKASTD
jgi:aspartate/methionine/tyrosine aminotransferase